MAIHYISSLEWFSSKRSSSKYAGVVDALVAHIRYISDERKKKGKEHGVHTADLDAGIWRERCDALVAGNRRARVAAKTCFALPVGIDGPAGAALVKEFFSTCEIFHEQFTVAGKRYTERCTLPPENIGVAVHNGTGISGHENPHAHIVIFPRSARGRSLDVQRRDLSRLHQSWRDFLVEKGFSLHDDPVGKGPHIGPRVLRHDEAARDAYRDRLYAAYLLNLVSTAEREEKRFDAMTEGGMGYQYDLTRIKSVSIEDVLAHEGIAFERAKDRVVFHAPWRDDKTASVSAQEVDGRWLFFDHGDKSHRGSVIDLVMQIRRISFEGALAYIAKNITPGAEIEPLEKPAKKPAAGTTRIVKTFDSMSAKSEAVLKKERGVAWSDLAKRGAKVAKVSFASGKTSFKVCYLNDSGGVELKDVKPSTFSGAIGRKDVSYHALEGSDEILVAESLFDAVAAQKIIGRECNILALNSAALAHRGIERIIAEKPAKVLLSLDNDARGAEAAAEIREACAKAGIPVETVWPRPGETAKDPCEALVGSFVKTDAYRGGGSVREKSQSLSRASIENLRIADAAGFDPVDGGGVLVWCSLSGNRAYLHDARGDIVRCETTAAARAIVRRMRPDLAGGPGRSPG